jgi:hypothetical protein
VLGANDITANPQFINAEGADFRLHSTSPAINKGLVWSMLSTDFAGNFRPSGTSYDIGAYEYQY